MIERWFRVRGRVQGVGFRAWVARTARSAGLSGAARNEADGSVVARVAAPDPASAEAFRVALARGPAAARVDAVEEIPPQAGSFDLRF